MAEVTGFTADRMLAMEDATVIDARLDGYDLILITKDATEINVGDVRGPIGPVGPVGEVEEAPLDGGLYLRQNGAWSLRQNISDYNEADPVTNADLFLLERAGVNRHITLPNMLAGPNGAAAAAQSTANSALSSANGRVSKTGDTMTGSLTAPSFNAGASVYGSNATVSAAVNAGTNVNAGKDLTADRYLIVGDTPQTAPGSTDGCRIAEHGSLTIMGGANPVGSSLHANMTFYGKASQAAGAIVGHRYLVFRDVAGNMHGSIINTGASVAYNTASDYRLKNEKGLITNALQRLGLLRPIRFEWKDNPGVEVDGFLAHEVSSSVPEAVQGEKDAVVTKEQAEQDESINVGEILPQGVDQSKVVPLLVAAVQELAAQVKDLQAQIA